MKKGFQASLLNVFCVPNGGQYSSHCLWCLFSITLTYRTKHHLVTVLYISLLVILLKLRHAWASLTISNWNMCVWVSFLDIYLQARYQNNLSINPFHATGLFLFPLKTLENLWFSDVFRGYRKRTVAWNGLN